MRGRIWVENSFGVRERKTVYGKTQADVEERFAELRAKNLSKYAEKMPLAAYLDSWLSTVRANLRPATFRLYETTVRIHILPRIGEARLGRLTSAHLRAFMNELAEKPPVQVNLTTERKPAGLTTRQNVHKILSRVFAIALKDELILRNPMVSVEKPRMGPEGSNASGE